jgi:hypothetical protein
MTKITKLTPRHSSGLAETTLMGRNKTAASMLGVRTGFLRPERIRSGNDGNPRYV